MPLGQTFGVGPSYSAPQTSPSFSAIAGMQQPNIGSSSTPVGTNQKIVNPTGAYNASVGQTGEDYDKIMAAYGELLKKNQASGTNTPLNYTPITPQLSKYTTSPELQNSITNLGTLSNTGGYSGGDIANLRARAVSPIRSIYANAQRNLDRQRALQGGYSPNYTAATTKMARDMSEQLGQANTNVEAGIAQNVAQNKLSIAPSFANIAAQENAARTASEQGNTDTANRFAELNASMPLQYRQANIAGNNADLSAIEGMRSLYGTTPALVNTFGNQVAQAQQQGMTQQQINDERNRTALDFARPMFGMAS